MTEMSETETKILRRLANGDRLPAATRVQDMSRQKLRKQGLIAYCGKPARWQISAKGLAAIQKELP